MVNYTLWIGTTPGAKDALYYSTAHTSNPAGITSMTTSLQPGMTYYVTLWTLTSAGYTTTTSTFQTSATSTLSAPANGATVSPQNIQFNWAAVPGVVNYTLWIGTTAGAKDALYYTTAHTSNPAGITSTTASLNPGVTYYVTLWTLTSAGYATTTSTFQTAAMAYLTSPTNGATGVSQFQAFTWTLVPGAQAYELVVSPTGFNVRDNFNAEFAGNVTSGYVWDLQPNTEYYVALYTKTASGGATAHSTFTTSAAPLPANRSDFYNQIKTLTAQVRLEASSPGNAPMLGSFLYQNMVDHLATPASGASCGNFATALTDLLTQNQILSRLRYTTLDGADVHVLTEYWDPYNSRWQIADATFGVMYLDPNSDIGQGVEDLNALLLAGNLSAITPLWVTNGGSFYATTYYMDPVTYFNNPYPYGMLQSFQQVYDNVPNSPLPYLQPFTLGSAPPADSAYMFWFANSGDQVTINNAGKIVTVAPISSSGWASTVELYKPWSIVSSVPSGMQIYTPQWLASFPIPDAAALTSPSSGAIVAPNNICFNWTAVQGVINYTLWIGTTPGAQDALYYSTSSTANPAGITSMTASLNPGATYYVTLWTLTSAGYTTTSSTFQTSATSTLSAPANGAMVSPQNVPFSWTAVPGVVNYTLWIGTTPGAKDALYYSTAHTSNPAGTTSMTASLNPGVAYYATLWTLTSAGYTTSTSTFQTAGSSILSTPANGATVSPQSIAFSWTLVAGGLNYTLWVGTRPGAQDALYYSTKSTSNPSGATSTSATLQPGTQYYVTLWTQFSSGYETTTSTFQTSLTAAVVSPANGSANLDPAVPIPVSWTPVSGATSYELTLGSSPGANNYYDSGATSSTSTTVSLSPNTTYYARLWTTVSGSVTSADSMFSTGYALAHLTYPLDGETGVSQFQPFTWTAPQGATAYGITVSPTGYGVEDYFTGITVVVPPNTSEYVWSLQPNTTYYMKLCTHNPGPGGGACVSSTFTTGAAPLPPANPNDFYQTVQSLTAQVRQMTVGTTNVPAAGTYLYQMIEDHGGDPTQPTECGWFAAALLDEFTMNDILARQRNISLNGIVGHVLTEYWDPYNQKWEIADPTFGLVYFDPSTQLGQGVEDVSGQFLAGNYSGINALFVTSYGSQYATNYYMDPMTNYNEVDPFGMVDAQQQLNYLPNSPLPFLTVLNLSTVVGTAGNYEFQFANPTDTLVVQSSSTSIAISPQNSQGWSQSAYLSTGWSIVSAVPSGMQIYSFLRVMY